VSDSVQAEVPRNRRRTRRHRRNRLIRRGAAAVLALFTLGLSGLALRYLSPSLFLFRSEKSRPAAFEQAELSRQRLLTLNQLAAQMAPSAERPVYPYSVVPGGVQDANELKWVAEHDPIVGAHYAGFDYDHARVVRLALATTAYVSYRIGNRIYWMHHKVTLHKGEKVITDGKMTARARCANRIEAGPRHEVSPAVEPPAIAFDQPIRVPGGTAMQAPPVPFESALSHPNGLAGVGPLSLYDPIAGAGWVPISPPPLPSGLCGPNRKKGSDDSGCCPGDAIGDKKKKSGCGSGGIGVVPEPGTWVLFGSGLVVIGWQARRKMVQRRRIGRA
jgi:PEP-CTERM motif